MCFKLKDKKENLPPLSTTLLFFSNHSHYLEGGLGYGFAFIKLSL